MATTKVKKDESKKSASGSSGKPKSQSAKKAGVAKKATPAKAAPIKAATKKKAAEPVDDIPTDIRSARSSGRPSNKDRANTTKIKEDLKLLCSDWLGELRGKKGKAIPLELKVRLLPNYLKMIMMDEDEAQDEGYASMEALGQKYLTLRSAHADADEASREAAKAASTR